MCLWYHRKKPMDTIGYSICWVIATILVLEPIKITPKKSNGGPNQGTGNSLAMSNLGVCYDMHVSSSVLLFFLFFGACWTCPFDRFIFVGSCMSRQTSFMVDQIAIITTQQITTIPTFGTLIVVYIFEHSF